MSTFNHVRHAFTLVELIAVITVIVILIGLVAVGFNQVEKSRAISHTKQIFALIRQGLASAESKGIKVMPQPLGTVSATVSVTFHDDTVDNNKDYTGVIAGHCPVSPKQILSGLTASATRKADTVALFKILFGADVLAELNQLGAIRDNYPGDPAFPPMLMDAWGNEIVCFPSSTDSTRLVLQSGGKDGRLINPRKDPPFISGTSRYLKDDVVDGEP